MRLGEALEIARKSAAGRQRYIHLLCGFTPLHLAIFLKAYLSMRFSEDAICLNTGLYGDLEGNIQRAATSNAEGAVVVIEWSDLDPRLGWRSSGGWTQAILADIAVQTKAKALRLEAQLAVLSQAMPLAIVSPSLPLPPLTHLPSVQISSFELRLNAILSEFLERTGKQKGIKQLSATSLAMKSPPSLRYDIMMDLQTGFPYTLAHADAIAQLSVSCLFATPPKKGLITDLDQTLWKGILGDVGVESISWSLEGKSQGHALYQQLIASLAETGVLVAIASKNDPKLVEAALQRPDLLVPPARIFPIEIGWGAKSEMVARILKAWNIAADSVVFVDDSPMELAEVSEKHSAIECLQFPSSDPKRLVSFLWRLRDRFGKEAVTEEDRLRLNSLRVAAKPDAEVPGETSADFLARLHAKVTFEAAAADHTRAFELVNKTNQFNLNGVRYTEAEWKSRGRRPGAFLNIISYEDRFGPLGRIAVLAGCLEQDRCLVDVWVMSCRAFSRQIEFQTLRQLFRRSGVSAVRFQFRPTERNGPLQTFLRQFFPPDSLVEGELDLRMARFEQSCPQLFHEVID